MAGAGTLLLSGSLWFLPSTVYLIWATWRALRQEERVLRSELPGYEEYASRIRALVPFAGSRRMPE
jgi:protein-S-isoprenylcysteine O-methyltransferase Ste14